MGKEIERKFLVEGDGWRGRGAPLEIRQGYLSRDPDRTVRIRIREDAAWLTIKGRGEGPCRPEFEYPIPAAEAEELLALCREPVIDKSRHRIPHGGLLWEVDEFHGDLEGLVLAEVELDAPDREIDLPAWVGEEVTSDPRFLNANLTRWPLP